MMIKIKALRERWHESMSLLGTIHLPFFFLHSLWQNLLQRLTCMYCTALVITISIWFWIHEVISSCSVEDWYPYWYCMMDLFLKITIFLISNKWLCMYESQIESEGPKNMVVNLANIFSLFAFNVSKRFLKLDCFISSHNLIHVYQEEI